MNERRAGPPKAATARSTGRTGLDERQRETAQYLTDMILELRTLARTAQLHAVMVPLEFAYYEAFALAHQVAISPDDIERLEDMSEASERMDRDPNNRGV